MSSKVIPKNNSICFWRIVFTLLVILLHCGYAQGGYIAVEYFFLVSGVLLAKNIYENSDTILEFIIKRIKRLYPMYIFALITYIVVQTSLDSALFEVGMRECLSNILTNILQQWKSIFMLQIFGTEMTLVNFPAWYVAALFWVSLLYYVLAKLMSPKVYKVFIISTITATAIYFFIVVGNLDLWMRMNAFLSEGFFRAYIEIGLGILLYNIKESLSKKKTRIDNKYIVLIEIIGYLIIIVSSFFLKETRFDYLYLVIMSLCVLASFSEHNNSILCNKAIEEMSRFSYGTYLNHAVFLICVGLYGIPFDNPSSIEKLIWVLPSSIICAIVAETIIGVIMKRFVRRRQ